MKWLVLIIVPPAVYFIVGWLRGHVTKSKNPFALRIFRGHNLWLKLGPAIGGRIVKFYAYLSILKILNSGGIEGLAYVAYSHMLREGELEYNRLKGKKNGTQAGMRKNKR